MTLAKNRDDYVKLPGTVWSLCPGDKLRMYVVQASVPHEDRPGSIGHQWWGTKEELEHFWPEGIASTMLRRDAEVPQFPDEFGAVLPFLPLPMTHNLPVGRLWSSSIGLQDFLDDISSLSGHADVSARGWLSHPLTSEFFSAVGKYADRMCLPLVYRKDIEEDLPSLITPANTELVSAEVYLRYLEDGLAYRLHRDKIIATLLAGGVSSAIPKI
ncbi:MAG: hypothetical protein ACREBR_03505 [bacterium]